MYSFFLMPLVVNRKNSQMCYSGSQAVLASCVKTLPTYFICPNCIQR